MTVLQTTERRMAAGAALDQQENRHDGLTIANSLADGLNTLRDSFYTRAHVDVEINVGMDSMLMPISQVESESKAKTEIDVYLVAESIVAVHTGHYLASDDAWYSDWLAELRLGEGFRSPAVAQRLAYYASKSPDDRRRAFSLVLERALPEARHAPLIMYRLFPLAAAVATAVAFRDTIRAGEARARQRLLLPQIGDCHECRGRLLENAEHCRQCGNPFWKFEWLTAE